LETTSHQPARALVVHQQPPFPVRRRTENCRLQKTGGL